MHIGEVKTARYGKRLKAILGSCVGVGLLWRASGICGLAHCLLPEAPERQYMVSGRFVDQAIPSLIALLRIREGDFKNVEAIVVGGGNMMANQFGSTHELVGSRNSEVALKLVKEKGFNLIYSEVGGECGRCITISSADFSYKVRSIPRFDGFK